MRYENISHSEEATLNLGRHIGERLAGGEIILLESDLGGGKTTLTKGIVDGIGSDEVVSSPTFTITQLYNRGRIEVHHYDLYRLGELGLMNDELQEVLTRKDVVVVIEWPDLAKDSLPEARVVHIALARLKSDESDRQIIINYPESLEYLIDERKLDTEIC
jgi:tRNA threonylcarbamoyladenosine biosynthesis protein TsaE